MKPESSKYVDVLREELPQDIKSVKIQKNQILTILIEKFWKYFQNTRVNNISGFLSKETTAIYIGNPPEWFVGEENRMWANMYGHSPYPSAIIRSTIKVPTKELDLQQGLVSTLYEECLLNLCRAVDECFSKENFDKEEPYLKRLGELLVIFHRLTLPARFPEEPVPHLKLGLTTACDVSFGLIEVVATLMPAASLQELETLLRHPHTFRVLRSIAALSLSQITAFSSQMGSPTLNSIRVSNIAPYRRILKPEYFKLENGVLKLNLDSIRSQPVTSTSGPYTGCPALQADGLSEGVLPELWGYFVHLYLSLKAFQDASLKQKIQLKIQARESGVSLLNLILTNRGEVQKCVRSLISAH